MYHKWWPISPGIERCTRCFLLRRRIQDGEKRREEHSLDYGKTWRHLHRVDVPGCPMQEEKEHGSGRTHG